MVVFLYCLVGMYGYVGGVGGVGTGCGRRQGRRIGVVCELGGKGGRGSRFMAGLMGRDRDRDGRIAGIALPALGTLLVEPLLSLADTAFVGRLGVAELGGVGVATVLLKGCFALFNFLAASTTPLVATKGEDAPGIVVQSLYIAALFGGVLALILYGLAPVACKTIAGAASSKVVPHAVVYARWRAIAAPALLMGYVLSGAYRGLQDTVTPLFVALAANAVNLVLDYVSIFVFGWGVAGAAIATSVAQVLNVIGLLAIMFQRGWIKASDWRQRPTLESLREIAFGAILSVRTLSIIATFTASSRFAALRGASTLAAYEVARQVWMLQANFLDALAVAAQSIVSISIHEKDPTEARAFSTRLLQLGIRSGAVLGAVTFLFAEFLPKLFSTDILTQSLTTQIIRSFAPLQPICAIVFVFDGIFVATRDYKYTARSIFLAGVASWLALIYATLQPLWGVSSVWFGINVLMIGRAVALGSRYFSPSCPLPRISQLTQDKTTEKKTS